MKNLSSKLLLCLVASLWSVGRVHAQTPYVIDSIEVRLFYNENDDLKKGDIAGNFSKPIDDSSFVLWNTIIGAGDAEAPSNQTFVRVHIIRKDPHSEYTLRSLEFLASTATGTLVKRKVSFSMLNEFDKSGYYIAFMVCDTGCEELRLNAQIVDPKSGMVESAMSRTIPFECGE